jgi:hypothetical protein
MVTDLNSMRHYYNALRSSAMRNRLESIFRRMNDNSVSCCNEGYVLISLREQLMNVRNNFDSSGLNTFEKLGEGRLSEERWVTINVENIYLSLRDL